MLVIRLHNESDAKVSRARHEHAQRLQEGGSGSDDEYDYDPDDLPSKDFVVSALDVVCGLCEGLGGAFATLVVAQSDTSQRLLTALGGCCKDIVPEVRQSALSLAGEISRRNLSLLAPMLQAGFYVEMLAANMDASHPYVCNNACWCIGELALQAGPQGMQGAGGLIHRLSSILREVEGPASMRQNAAIAIGRLALANTADVAGSMHEVTNPVYKAIKHATIYLIPIYISIYPSVLSNSTSHSGARRSVPSSIHTSATRPSRGY